MKSPIPSIGDGGDAVSAIGLRFGGIVTFCCSLSRLAAVQGSSLIVSLPRFVRRVERSQYNTRREGNAGPFLATKNPPARWCSGRSRSRPFSVLAGAVSDRLKASPALLLVGWRLCADSGRWGTTTEPGNSTHSGRSHPSTATTKIAGSLVPALTHRGAGNREQHPVWQRGTRRRCAPERLRNPLFMLKS